jgi:hypothetical protein
LLLEKQLIVGESIALVEEGVFYKIWQSPDPSNVIAFSWQFHNCILTRSNLVCHRVLQQDYSKECVVCEGNIDTSIIYSYIVILPLPCGLQFFEGLGL